METSCISDSMFKVRGIHLVAFVLLAASCDSVVETEPTSEQIPLGITEKLNNQENAWNEGEIEAFMSNGYWANDSLLFIGKSGVTLGYNHTLENYLKSYPNREAMGTLKFDLLNWRPLGSDHGLLIGSWHLQRMGSLESLSGHFSLTWKKIEGEWFIIADHSS